MPQAVNWEDSRAELRRLVPAAPAFFPADEVVPAADAAARPAASTTIPDWADETDLVLLDRVFADRPEPVGPLLICTAHLAFHGSPIRLSADRLRGYVGGHLAAAGECFFNGDVVILDPPARRLTVFREGEVTHWAFDRAGHE